MQHSYAVLNRKVKTGALESDFYTVTTEHNDYSAMVAQTPTNNTFHRAKADDGPRLAGYWKYEAGLGTFSKIVFDAVSADPANPEKYVIDGQNPGGFKIPFTRLALALTAATWDEEQLTLAETALFANNNESVV